MASRRKICIYPKKHKQVQRDGLKQAELSLQRVRFKRELYSHTSVWSYACCAVHSALLVGLLRAKINGLSLFFAISFRISGVKAPAAAEAPARNILILNILGGRLKRVLFTYQNGRLDLPHNFEQRFHHFVILRVPYFVTLQITLGPIFYEQSVNVHHPYTITRLLLSATVSLHRFHAEISYSDGRL